MTIASDTRKCNLQTALDRALDALGESSKRAMVYYLTNDFGLDLQSPKLTLQEIEDALASILGVGASVLMARLHEQLGGSKNSHNRNYT